MRALAVFVTALALAGCPPAKNPGPQSGIDPEACGNLAVSDVGRALHAFLVATVELDRHVTEIDQAMKASCKTMGSELHLPAADLEGPTKDVCEHVMAMLKGDLHDGLGATALVVDYKRGACTLDVDAAARAAAQCEGKASGSALVTCDGTCTGACHGTCNGTCAGAAGGECNGRCDGTCTGSCSGGCTGAADVQASAQCKAQAEVHASVTAQCTEPQLTIALPPQGIADAAKAGLAVNALRKGLPKILWIAARVKPLAHAVEGWATAAGDLAQSGDELAQQFAERAVCVGGQIAAAVAAVAHIQASISVSVEISAQASGTIGAGP